MQNQVFIINNVNFEDLPTLYQSSKIFIYPSFFEGFGIPIIEAFNSQTPVITSNINIFKEVADDAALFFENNSTEDLSEKILLLLNDESQRQDIIRKGENRAKFFSGKNIATDLRKVYKNLL